MIEQPRNRLYLVVNSEEYRYYDEDADKLYKEIFTSIRHNFDFIRFTLANGEALIINKSRIDLVSYYRKPQSTEPEPPVGDAFYYDSL